MPIFIGTDYKLEAQRLNIVLFRKTDSDSAGAERFRQMWKERKAQQGQDEPDTEDKNPDDQKGWVVEGYYANVKYALRALLNHAVEKTDLKDVQTVVNRINEVKELINSLSLQGLVSLESAIGL